MFDQPHDRAGGPLMFLPDRDSFVLLFEAECEDVVEWISEQADVNGLLGDDADWPYEEDDEEGWLPGPEHFARRLRWHAHVLIPAWFLPAGQRRQLRRRVAAEQND